MGSAEAKLQIFGGQGGMEVQKRNFASLEELAEWNGCHIIGSQGREKSGSVEA